MNDTLVIQPVENSVLENLVTYGHARERTTYNLV